MIWFIIVLLLAGGILGGIWWWPRPNPERCPQCGSLRIGEVSKNPLGMAVSESGSGGPGGGYTTVQVKYEVKYRCGACGAKWQKTVSEY
jgi:hypothetical protein